MPRRDRQPWGPLPFKPHFNAADPLDLKCESRYDLSTDEAINLMYLLHFGLFFNESCTP